MKILQAQEGKVFAYRNAAGDELVLGEMLFLGKNDDGSRYYQIDKLEEKFQEQN